MSLPKYKICPECGKHNSPGLLECSYCEADLTAVKVVDPETEASTPLQNPAPSDSGGAELVRICECGAENAPQARKCIACGEDISDILPVPAGRKKAFAYELVSFDGSFSATIDKPFVVLGREAELQEYLKTKSYVARQQAKLTVVAEKVFVENLSHTNGTFVNNAAIPDGAPTALTDGDEIGLGGKVVDGSRQDNAAYLVFRVKP